MFSTSSNFTAAVTDNVNVNDDDSGDSGDQLSQGAENQTTEIQDVVSCPPSPPTPSCHSSVDSHISSKSKSKDKRSASKRSAADPVGESIMEYLKKKQCSVSHRDADESFLLSFVPVLNGLQPEEKSRAKVKIAEFMHTLQFGSSSQSDLRPPAIIPTMTANSWMYTQNQQVPPVQSLPDPNLAYNQSQFPSFANTYMNAPTTQTYNPNATETTDVWSYQQLH